MTSSRKITQWIAALTVSFGALAAPSYAAPGPATGKTGSRFGVNVGAGYSVGITNTAGSGLGFTWLAGVRYHLNENLFFGAEYQSFGGTSAASGTSTVSSGVAMYRANANYFLSEGSYAGVNAGLQTATATVTVLGVPVSSSTSSVSIGPQIGYMFDLTHGFSLAPEASLHINLSSPMTMWASGIVRLGYTF